MEQPITLYFGLEAGTNASLETIAKSSLAFEKTVREIAFVIDPFLEFRLEIESGTEGSLKLNSIIRAAKDKVTDKKTLGSIVFLLACWFGSDIRTYITEHAIEVFIKDEQGDTISDEDAKRIAEQVVKLLKGRVGEEQSKKVFQELEGDKNITGVGVTTVPDGKPKQIVPRSQFSERARPDAILEVSTPVKIDEAIETVTLISPVLLANNRRWRFSFHQGEFGAPILDQDFLERVLSGREPVSMVAGITMRVRLQTKSELIDGVWAIKERSILKVIEIIRAQRQGNLDLSPPEKGNTN